MSFFHNSLAGDRPRRASVACQIIFPAPTLTQPGLAHLVIDHEGPQSPVRLSSLPHPNPARISSPDVRMCEHKLPHFWVQGVAMSALPQGHNHQCGRRVQAVGSCTLGTARLQDVLCSPLASPGVHLLACSSWNTMVA